MEMDMYVDVSLEMNAHGYAYEEVVLYKKEER